MYRILSDGKLIYDPRLKDYAITQGKCDLAVNAAGSLTFTIPKSYPNYEEIKLMKSTIELWDDDRLVFQGRPYAPTIDYYQNDRIVCEGALAYLNDSVQPPFEFTGDASTLFGQLIASHNSQVDASRQLLMGDTDATVSITRSSSEYLSTWDVISEYLVESVGGYVQVRRENGANYIDYVSLGGYAEQGTQQVLQGINLLDAEKSTTSETLATVVIPLGARIKDANGVETNSRVTIESANGGLDYLEDLVASDTYGRITKVVIHDDITSPSALKSAGQTDLSGALGVVTNYTFTAANLARAGYSVDSFKIGEFVRVRVETFDIDDTLLIRDLSLNLLAPEEDVLTIGKSTKTITSSMNNMDRQLEAVRQSASQNIQTIASKIDGVAFKQLTIAASASETLTFSGTSRGAIWLGGLTVATIGQIQFAVLANGTVRTVTVQSASNVAVSTGTNTLTITNNYASGNVVATIMLTAGTMPA